MNKKKQIEFYKKQLATSQEMQAVAMQNYTLAARLETTAKSALQELGAQEEQGRKVKHQLSEKDKLSLISGLTHGKRN